VFNLQYIHINPSQSKWNNYVAENKIKYLFSLDYFQFLPDDDIITLGSHSRSSAFLINQKFLEVRICVQSERLAIGLE